MKKHFMIMLLLCLLLTLVSCGKDTDLQEGDCYGVITFTDVPKEYYLLDETAQEKFNITVILENIATEKEYEIILNQKNSFRQEVSLHPGTYRVEGAFADRLNTFAVPLETSSQSLEFSQSHQAVLMITLQEPEKLTMQWMEVQPLPEIRLADKYSGLLQINRKIINIKDILPELKLDGVSSGDTLEGLQKATVTDSEKGITVQILNPSENPLPYTSCTVTGITVTKNTVVFPEGVTIGMSPDLVCHKQNGLYQEPDKVEGSLLYGWSIDTTKPVYYDPVSGNRITLTIQSNASAIASISYEIAVFE